MFQSMPPTTMCPQDSSRTEKRVFTVVSQKSGVPFPGPQKGNDRLGSRRGTELQYMVRGAMGFSDARCPGTSSYSVSHFWAQKLRE